MRRHRAGPRNHFQIQRALLSLIASDDRTSVAIETLDDLVVEGDEGAIRDFEQLLLGAGDVAGFVGAEEVAAWLEGELLTTGLNHHPSGPVALARFGDLAQRGCRARPPHGDLPQARRRPPR